LIDYFQAFTNNEVNIIYLWCGEAYPWRNKNLPRIGEYHMSDQKCQEEYIRKIHKVQDYIEHHLGQSLSIEELSNAAGFSKYHFSRIFTSI